MNTRMKLIAAVLLIAVGAGGRFLLQDMPNIETIMVVTLLAGMLLGARWGISVGLISIAITDIVMGNTIILAYTWSAWAAIALFGYVLHKRATTQVVRRTAELTGMGLLATFAFFAWTNLGVWHVGGLYPHTLAGLAASYTMAIPFLKSHLISTLVFVPSVSLVALTAWNYATQLQSKPKTITTHAKPSRS